MSDDNETMSDDHHATDPVSDRTIAAERPRRRLSYLRVFGVIVLIAAAVGGVMAFRSVDRSASSATVSTAWAAPYVDVTIPPLYSFESPGEHVDDVVLSFIVAHTDDPCRPAWGSVFSLDEAASELDLDRRLVRLRQTGKDAVISFGGAINDELSVSCTDTDDLVDAYAEVVERYEVTTIDLDVEGLALGDDDANSRRGEALARVQSDRRAAGSELAIWVTLPVSPAGLTADGRSVLDALLDHDVDVAGVNGMVMNFGGSREGRSMSESVEDAVDSMATQIVDAWRLQGMNITDDEAYARVGATAMIGRNDVVDDVFTLDDARSLRDLALDRNLGRLGYWSLNRDRPCGTNEAPIASASNFCTHLEQEEFSFAEILNDLPGRASEAAGADVEWERIELIEDDPETSPYQIWRPDRAFVGGAKVVWHGYVYEAKWWTQGHNPELPVENPWDSPWQIIGPVLPDDLVDRSDIPAGVAPEWDGEAVYDTGDRVWIDGAVYEAKWWNTGFPPNRDVPNDWDTPWTELDPSEYADG